ncbi:MAG: hypothetical protein U0V02_20085 [Anaerolineales bacterium]
MTKRFYLSIKQILVSIMIGAATAYALVFYYFNKSNYSPTDTLFLFIIPSLSAAICAYFLIPIFEKALLPTTVTTKSFLFSFAAISALIVSFPTIATSYLLSASVLISSLTIFFASSAPAALAFQKIIEAKNHIRLLAGWATSTFIVFIITGFLDDFYSSSIEIICITLITQILIGTSMYFLVHRLGDFAKKHPFDFTLLFLLFLTAPIFIQRFFQYGTEAPELLNPQYFLLSNALIPVVSALSIFFIPWQAWLLSKIEIPAVREKFKSTKFYAFINENIAGIALSSTFFAIYLVIATVLNHPTLDVDDIFFDADGLNWRLRLTTDTWHDFYWRSVHPFVLLLLKPPVDFVAMLLRGNKLFGAYVVFALGGAICVFLAWKFVKTATGNIVYASLIASILGFSASHLVFGSLIETYIFLAAGLLLFFVFLLEEKPLSALIMASLPVIGITYTNFAQNVVALFSVKPSLKLIFHYVAVVLVLLVQLSLLSNLFFPDAQPFFFVPSTLQAEERNIFPLNTLRTEALSRIFLFHNVVAPTPILYNGDIPFTQFRFFKPEIEKLSVYDTPLQTFTAWFWLGLLALGFITFLIKYKGYKTNQLSLALLGTMALNIGIHLRYGKEIFLYSANWTYALILLLALALQGFAKHRWLQVTLLVFVFFLMYNNSWLFDTIFYVLSP